ncbi:NERD domain-containing protein [Streptomyces longispororuber]|uniref:nuclease-related domain-containing DEAD/DEAH box helicase n=1 Tax=Streptomyces longispororuber TaxID=68230 RepID=UPI0036F83827
MRIIPSEVPNGKGSRAERSVFAALKAIPDDESVALYSVHLPTHDYKRVGEIDFVVITPQLILYIEVKGGRISHKDGRWGYERDNGTMVVLPEGPFEQASSGMHEMERELRRSVPGLRARDAVGGYLVVTPDVDLAPMTTYTSEQYLGQSAYDEGRGLEAAIRRAGRYWRDKGRNRSAISPIPASLRKEIVRAVRPNFDRVPNLRSRITDLEVEFERLTTEQFEKIDELAENPRLIWKGGAGSGKTFLAAEAARRKSAHGSVLFTCASVPLARHLAHILTDESVTVLPYEQLGRLRDRSFDHLIVDEAQDLMNFAALQRLDGLVKGGLEEGHWIFMLDRNNQILSPEQYEPDAWAYLRTLGATTAVLTRNCRNTEQIVTQVQTYTGADLGTAMAGQGDHVVFTPVESKEHEARALDAYLDRLADEGVPPADITVLSSSGDWETSSVRLSRRFGRIERFGDTIGTGAPRRRITWSSVLDFKGLENRVVCVVDLELDALAERLDAVYVAWTRARAQLWIATRPEVQRRLKDLGVASLRRQGVAK